jgi:uracil-DNA glycosylase family 4
MPSKVPYAKCDSCPLQHKPIAKSIGPEDAKVVVVSRSPGYHEALNGKCFAGPSGKVLDHMLKLYGSSLKEVRATNVVLCQSPGPPEDKQWDQAVKCCAPRLSGELENAKTIIAAGGEAIKAILPDSSGGVVGNRGYEHITYSDQWGFEQRVICTNNPAVILRNDGAYPDIVRDFRLALNPLPKPELPQVKIIDDVEEAKQAVEAMLKQITSDMIIACDIEAKGVDGKTGLSHTAIPVCAGFSIRPERAVVFGESPCSDKTFLSDYLRRLYEIAGVRYVWHNGKYDIKVLISHGIAARVDEDTMLLSWVCDERPGNPEEGAGGHSLEWLLKDELGWPKYEPASVQHFKKKGNFEYYGTSEPQMARARKELYEYNGMDTAGTLALLPVLTNRAIAENTYERPYKFMLLDLSEWFARIELQGNIYDADAACDILEHDVWPKLEVWRDTMRRISHKPELNPNSHPQLGKLLYDEWGLKHNLQRPKVERQGKRSVDKYVREEIDRGDFTCSINRDTFAQFTGYLNDFKELDTQRGTFLEGLVLKRHSNGRIYTDIKIHGTESGRVSTSNPNMQNVTRPKEGLPNIRRVFKPDDGCVFVSADLSQAELRTIAVLSGDEGLQSIYLDTNRSLHKEVAADFYGADYTYEQYVRAKNINFGVVYWQSAFTFAQMYHMPIEEADAFVKWWWERFPQVWEWTKSIEYKVLHDGELQSPFGHKRRFYVIPSDQSGRLHVIKQGINFLPQNIAANDTLYALIQICKRLDWRMAQPRITVHDNIVCNAREDYAEECAAIMVEEMQSAALKAINWEFPYLADVSIGYTWGDLKELKI